MNIGKTITTLSLAAVLSLGVVGCGGSSSSDTGTNGGTTFTQVKDLPAAEQAAAIKAALSAYADRAIADYKAALADAKTLQTALTTFTNAPTEATFTAAKEAWLASRESYGITEIFRLSNGPIDAEEGFAATFGAPEGQLNAWPLDENYIDYIVDSSGTRTNVGIIYGTDTITKELLAGLNEVGGDANVATGYHAIEFLLWGQDQDYASFIADNVTHGATTAGQRPLSDYTPTEPSSIDIRDIDPNTASERRKTYLNAAVELMVDDLQSMVDAWTTGGYKEALIGEGAHAIDAKTALTQIMGGMGVFIKSELANERIAVAALTPSEEDEHSCFSDNTHRDIALNYQGFKNIVEIIAVYLSDEQKATIAAIEASIDAKVKIINDTAKSEYHFDYQIVEVNGKLQNIIDTKNEMRDLGDAMIHVAAEYGVSLGEEDVTDPGETEI